MADPNGISRRFACTLLATTVAGAITGTGKAASRAPGPIRGIVFDALGTLFDPAGIGAGMETIFPGTGRRILDVWRLKQLEYTWLCASARRYVPLATLSRRSLVFAIKAAKIVPDEARIARSLGLYTGLPCFPDVKPGLAALSGVRLAILSASGKPLLHSLLGANGLDGAIPLLVSTDAVRTYKPAPETYALARGQLGLPAREVMLVSSNGFDVWGAAQAGFRTAWLRRPGGEPPSTYETLRGAPEELEPAADHVIGRLTELPALLLRPGS